MSERETQIQEIDNPTHVFLRLSVFSIPLSYLPPLPLLRLFLLCELLKHLVCLPKLLVQLIRSFYGRQILCNAVQVNGRDDQADGKGREGKVLVQHLWTKEGGGKGREEGG